MTLAKLNKTTMSVSWWFLFLILLIPTAAYADIGIPMIALTYPAMLFSLLPIVLIETLIYRSALGMTFRKALKPSAIANGVSTILGFPIAWGMLFGLQFATYWLTGREGGVPLGTTTFWQQIAAVALQAAWLPPYEGKPIAAWMIPVAGMIQLVPAYYISVRTEYWILKKWWSVADQHQLQRAVWKANTLSYLLLLNLAVLGLILSIIDWYLKPGP